MKSVSEYSEMIVTGQYEACYFLGLIYRTGVGVKKDSKRAIQFYTLGVEHNVAKCFYELGNCLYFGNGIKSNKRKGVELVKKSFLMILREANAGDKDSQFIMGNYYGLWTIDIDARDFKKSDEWYAKAAENGHARAQAIVGFSYLSGYTIKQDYDKAIEWLTKAAEQSDVEGQYHLGNCYYKGEGVKQNKDKGIALIEKSAEQGFELAKIFLDDLKRG